jgi:hypothetical protein
VLFLLGLALFHSVGVVPSTLPSPASTTFSGLDSIKVKDKINSMGLGALFSFAAPTVTLKKYLLLLN